MFELELFVIQICQLHGSISTAFVQVDEIVII